MVLILAMPCAMVQASNIETPNNQSDTEISNHQVELAMILIQKYNECIKKAENKYWSFSNRRDLHREKDRCTAIFSLMPNTSPSTQQNMDQRPVKGNGTHPLIAAGYGYGVAKLLSDYSKDTSQTQIAISRPQSPHFRK